MALDVDEEIDDQLAAIEYLAGIVLKYVSLQDMIVAWLAWDFNSQLRHIRNLIESHGTVFGYQRKRSDTLIDRAKAVAPLVPNLAGVRLLEKARLLQDLLDSAPVVEDSDKIEDEESF